MKALWGICCQAMLPNRTLKNTCNSGIRLLLKKFKTRGYPTVQKNVTTVTGKPVRFNCSFLPTADGPTFLAIFHSGGGFIYCATLLYTYSQSEKRSLWRIRKENGLGQNTFDWSSGFQRHCIATWQRHDMFSLDCSSSTERGENNSNLRSTSLQGDGQWNGCEHE